MPIVPRDGGHDENAASIINAAEVLFDLLDAVGPKTVVEVGALHGKSTGGLIDWAAAKGTRVIAIDPSPEPDLVELSERRPELDLMLEISHEALPKIEGADAIILDGDHNYYTLSEELRLIEERAPGAELPLLILHDVGWPLARRDQYHAPERIPEEHRQPLARDVYLTPDESGLADGGLPFVCVAAHEGGPRNGILTAVEDFIGDREGLRLAIIPAFFGIGVLWHRDAPWSDAVAAVVGPWDRNPMIARLEANRVVHMVERWRLAYGVAAAMPAWRRREAQEELLRSIVSSRGFALAQQLSRVRHGGRPAVSHETIEHALGDA